MTLKCSEDGRPEDLSQKRAIYVCHHCGRPVCQDHGLVVSADDAFNDSVEAPGDGTPSVRRVAQPAMHCKQCAEQYHRKADKHPGWKDPRTLRMEEAARAARARAAAAAQVPQQQAPPGPRYQGPQHPGPGQYPGQGQYPGPGPQYPGPGQQPGQWGQRQPGQPGFRGPQQPDQR